ncbi:hypothetical protein KJ966_26615 [bacterium]|nr:hypothetical protein [bacterium]
MKKGAFRDSFLLRSRVTIFIYLSLLLVLILIIGYAGRHIIFRPWTSRNMVSAAVVDNSIFCFGGMGENNVFYRDILQIDLEENIIRRLDQLPQKVIGLRSEVVNGKIYLIGGLDRTSFSDKILVFDSQSHELTEFAELPFPAAFGDSTLINKDIFYIGGWTGQNYLDTIIKIETQTGKVKTIGRLPTPREYVGTASYQGKIYLFGGEDHNGHILDDILEIDPENGEVLRTTKLPSPRMYMETAVLNGKIFMTGGWADGIPYNDILMMDPVSLEVKTNILGHTSQKLLYKSLVTVGDNIYLIGGADDLSNRQIGVVKIDINSKTVSSPSLKSYSWM